MSGLVIVGGSYAGVQAATTARELGYADAITMISDEDVLPYQRPPLSKSFLTGEMDEARLILRGEKYFAARHIDLRLKRRAVEIDKVGRKVLLDDGTALACDHVLIATGSRARALPVVEPDAAVLYLRSLADARELKQRLIGCSEFIVIGGGFIGLEAAASARKLGKKVTVIESLPRLIQRALSATVSDFLLKTHRAHGVDVRLGTAVNKVVRNGAMTEVQCTDANITGDLVLIGIGGVPNAELAEGAGIACDNGIIVDEVGRSGLPFLLAAGDCAAFEAPFASRRLRLESVQHAQDQAKAVGAFVAGQHHPYNSVPRFWSDQYEFKLQMVGFAEGDVTPAIRGSLEEGKFSVFLYRDGKLIAVDSVNRPADQLIARALIAAGVSPSPAQAADLSFDLKTLVPHMPPSQ